MYNIKVENGYPTIIVKPRQDLSSEKSNAMACPVLAAI
jgi:hypothetical protein